MRDWPDTYIWNNYSQGSLDCDTIAGHRAGITPWPAGTPTPSLAERGNDRLALSLIHYGAPAAVPPGRLKLAYQPVTTSWSLKVIRQHALFASNRMLTYHKRRSCPKRKEHGGPKPSRDHAGACRQTVRDRQPRRQSRNAHAASRHGLIAQIARS